MIEYVIKLILTTAKSMMSCLNCQNISKLIPNKINAYKIQESGSGVSITGTTTPMIVNINK